MAVMKGKTLHWLKNQQHPQVRGCNGKAHDEAVDMLIEQRAGEEEIRQIFTPMPRILQEEEEGVVEVVEYGGRGGKLRIVHPR